MSSRSQLVESTRSTVDALDDAQRSIADAARSAGQIEARMDSGDGQRVDDAAPLLRALFTWLEDHRDESDRADRAVWQEQVLQLGQAMSILRIPLYKDV